MKSAISIKKVEKNNRCQAEIMGLAVIVILIVIGLFIYLSFQLTPRKIEISSVEKQMAISMVTALYKTDTPCGNLGRYLIPECSDDNAIISCTIDSISVPFSCDAMTNITDTILDKTIFEWGSHFDFVIEDYDGSILYNRSNECPPGAQRSAYETQPVPLWPKRFDQAAIRLAICE
ncbi:hypothetical protein JW868_02840 [Candidatus Woesearchaeota archaeon]|nr:hypothetical protein [Candidatus Woesearchaeota archaeon]